MSSYRRFISYMHQYPNGKKGNNCGFVKIEVKNNICSLWFQLKKVPSADTVSISFFIREKDAVALVPIWEGSCPNGTFQQHLTTDSLHLFNTNYSFRQCGGIILRQKNCVICGSCWDSDGVVPVDLPNAGANIKPTSPTESSQNNISTSRQDTNIQNTPKVPKYTVDESSIQYPNDQTLNSTISLTSDNTFTSDVNSNWDNNSNSNNISNSNNKPNSDNDSKSNNNSKSDNDSTSNNNFKSDNSSKPNGNIILTSTPNRKASENSSETDDNTDTETNPHTAANIRIETNPDSASDTSSDTSSNEKEEAQKKPPTFEELWESMQKKYPPLDPFEEGGIVEGIKISPSDLPYLQCLPFDLGANRFLLHGYKNYKHLLLGRMEGQNRYILGIPGVFDSQEQFMAKMFGFPCFKPIRSCMKPIGQFGYWFRCIHS